MVEEGGDGRGARSKVKLSPSTSKGSRRESPRALGPSITQDQEHEGDRGYARDVIESKTQAGRRWLKVVVEMLLEEPLT